MSKNFVSIIVFVLLLCIFIGAFSKSYSSHNISNLAYVLALGIDVGENAKMKISAQFTKTAAFSSSSGSSSDDSENIVLVSCEADSIFSGINLLNTYIGKEVNLSHCSVIIFSEEFARNGISTEIYSLVNSEEIRPSTNLVVSKCSAYEYLNNVQPNLEKLTTKYFDTFAITSKFTGYISNISIGYFYNDFCSKSCDPTAILGGLNYTARSKESEKSDENSSSKQESSSESSSGSDSNSNNSNDSNSNNSNSSNSNSSNNTSEQQENVSTEPETLTAENSSVIGKRGNENIGIAVFNGDKYCGELTAVETICHLLIIDKLDSCIISVDNPLVEGKKMELQLFPKRKAKVIASIKDNRLHVSIDLNIDADVMTLEDDIDYSKSENLDKISISAEEYLKKEMDAYLKKVTKEYEADIDSICARVFSLFATISDLEEFNLREKYKDTEYDVNINVNVISTLLLTKT